MIDYRDNYYVGVTGWKNRRVLKKLIQWGRLWACNGLILDYGCGHAHLKALLPPHIKVVGYDLIPELSDVPAIDGLQPDIIVCSNVLEHMSIRSIGALLEKFKRMNPDVQLLVALPTENRISKLSMRLLGADNAHDDHVSWYRHINRVIEAQWWPLRRCCMMLGTQQVTHYCPKKVSLGMSCSS